MAEAALSIPPLDFQAYLEAKQAVDERSLEPGLLELFRNRLEADPAPRLLDLGTGTGAMLRRVLEFRLSGEAELTGLDSDARSLELADRRIGALLRARGARARVRLVQGDLLDPGTPEKMGRVGYGYLTAHAFLDLLPPARALRAAWALLAPGGLLYATLNYDGSTELLPEDGDPGFEREMLAAYDRSMELRRVSGEPTGGARSGRRLEEELGRCGFRLLGAGRSDWDLPPASGPAARGAPGPHEAGTAVFLQALLGMIAGEGQRDPAIDAGRLRAWWRRRNADLRSGRLGLRARNLDLLAARE